MTIKVGDELSLLHWDESVKVVYVSPSGEFVYQFSDGSIDVTNEEDMENRGLSIKEPEVTITKYIPVVRDKVYSEIVISEVWDSIADINTWYPDGDPYSEVIDIIEVIWTNAED